MLHYLICVFFLQCMSFHFNVLSYEYHSSGFFTAIHVLVVDPKEHRIHPVRASGEPDSRETVYDLAHHHGATAAINGGFWKPNGDPAGILMIDHKWYATPTIPRGAIGWAKEGKCVLIDQLLTNCTLMDCPSQHDLTVIPASVPSHTTSEQWKEMEHIVGGAPVIVKGGNLVLDYSSEKTLLSFLTRKHPRTAVGIRKNGEWVFVVVDGRFLGFFGGMTVDQLGQLMLKLGCVEALNLDGGGSSTMVINDHIVNRPSGTLRQHGKRVAAVSDAILIFD